VFTLKCLKQTKRFCKLGSSGLNLEKDYPSVYVIDLTNNGGEVNFIAAAPWSELQCNIDIDKFEHDAYAIPSIHRGVK
jgi:hypothetical protein